METRTSDTDPIWVDFIDPAAHGLPGRLGLTFAPGKRGAGLYGYWDRDLVMDLARLRNHYQARVLVTLLREQEMEDVNIPDLRESAQQAGMKSLWFPIPEVSAPRDPADAIPLVREVLGHLAAGDTVVVHCMGGLGRAGTIAACVLVARGLEPAAAVEVVQAARKGALQAPAQVAFIGQFRDAWRAA